MAHTYTHPEYHLVFATAYRSPWLTTNVRSELFKIMGHVVRSRGGVLHAAGGVDDHTHLDLEIPVSQRVCDMVASIKGNSARWLKEGWPRLSDFRWQRGYSLFTVSSHSANALRAYIANQEQHHANYDLVAELDRLLRGCGRFDEAQRFKRLEDFS